MASAARKLYPGALNLNNNQMSYMKREYFSALEGEQETQEAISEREKELFDDSIVVGGVKMSVGQYDHLRADEPLEEIDYE